MALEAAIGDGAVRKVRYSLLTECRMRSAQGLAVRELGDVVLRGLELVRRERLRCPLA